MFESMYHLSLVTIIKDEPNLEQFLMYYRLLGVEHFYIYDNESSPSIADRLDRYPYFQRFCTIIQIKGRGMQLSAYNHFQQTFADQTYWAIMVDGDEYIVPKTTFTLPEFLIQYDDYHAIGINWIIFGTNGHESFQTGYVIDKYRRRCANQNRHVKSIMKPQHAIGWYSPHFPVLKDRSRYCDAHRRHLTDAFNDNYTMDIIQLNHYWFRSAEYTRLKTTQNRCDLGIPRVTFTDDPNGDYTMTEIYEAPHRYNNDMEDSYAANKYLPHLRRMMTQYLSPLPIDVERPISTPEETKSS